MSSSETRYSFRFSGPQYLERAREQRVTMPARHEGALAVPSAGTYSLFDPSNTAIVDAQAINVVASVAGFTIPAATLPSTIAFNEGWREEWVLTMPDTTVRTVIRDTAFVRHAMFPVVTLADLVGVHSNIVTLLPDNDDDAQDKIDEAWKLIDSRLVSKGNRTYLAMSPWSFRESHLWLTLMFIFRDARTTLGEGDYSDLARDYKTDFEDAWAQLTWLWDSDQDGVVDDSSRRRSGTPVVYLNSAPGWR